MNSKHSPGLICPVQNLFLFGVPGSPTNQDKSNFRGRLLQGLDKSLFLFAANELDTEHNKCFTFISIGIVAESQIPYKGEKNV